MTRVKILPAQIATGQELFAKIHDSSVPMELLSTSMARKTKISV